MPAGVAPARWLMAQAATTFEVMCRPGRRTAPSGASGTSPASPRCQTTPARTETPRSSTRVDEYRTSRAGVPAPRASVSGWSAFSTFQSAAVWLAKIRALAAAYDASSGWRSR